MSERAESGLTNEVDEREGTVVKEFMEMSLPAIIFLLERMVFKQSLGLLETRRRNEIEVREALGDKINYPEILSMEEDRIVMEEIEGELLYSYLKENGEEAERYGRILGSMMNDLQEEGIYLGDWSLDNMKISGGDLYFYDFEFGSDRYRRGIEFQEKVTLLYSVKTLSGGVYSDFRSGLQNEIDVGITAEIASNILGILVTLLDERNPEKTKRTILNSARK